MKAYLKNYRQSPRKVRQVAGLIRGKNAIKAMTELSFLPKRAALPMQNLLKSALANAKNMGVDTENLLIKELRVDKGITMKRIMPAAMGSAHRINKRASHVILTLGEKVIATKKSKVIKETVKPVAKPKAKAKPKTKAKTA